MMLVSRCAQRANGRLVVNPRRRSIEAESFYGEHAVILDQVSDLTPGQIAAARLAVCDRARDTDEARDLLDKLGLLND